MESSCDSRFESDILTVTHEDFWPLLAVRISYGIIRGRGDWISNQ